MIKLKEIALSNQDSERITKAFEFFRKQLSLTTDIKLEYYHPTEQTDAEVSISGKNVNDFKYTIKVSDVSWNTMDIRLTALAHEMVHVHQIVNGKLDPFKKTWEGKPATSKNYWKEPWEIDARVESRKLVIEFNRAMRDGKI